MIQQETAFMMVAMGCLSVVVWTLSRQRFMGSGGSQANLTPADGTIVPNPGDARIRKLLAGFSTYSGFNSPRLRARAWQALALMFLAIVVRLVDYFGTPTLLEWGLVPSDYPVKVAAIVLFARDAVGSAVVLLLFDWLRSVDLGGSNKTDNQSDDPGATEVSEGEDPDSERQHPDEGGQPNNKP